MLEIRHKPYLTRIFFPGRFRVRKQTSRCQLSSKKFWPSLFRGRWLKQVSLCLRRNSHDYEVSGWDCPRGLGCWVFAEQDSHSLRYSRRYGTVRPRATAIKIVPSALPCARDISASLHVIACIFDPLVVERVLRHLD